MIIKAVTYGEMQEIDRISIDEFGIPASVLMNNAGKSVAGFIKEKFTDKKIIIFCGTGNNGGDGFTAAYYLANTGTIPDIYLAGKKDKVSETSKIFLNLCEKINIPVTEIDTVDMSSITITPGSIVVDAILGTGLSSEPRGIPAGCIKLINGSGSITVSIDIPSGLTADGEKPSWECIKADFTITIGLPKIALATYPCKSFCGELIIQDIGFPAVLTTNEKLKVTLINDSLFKTFNLRDSQPDVHKGDRGYTMLIGGFTNMEGAAILTASALFNTGCGLLTIATEAKSREIIAGKIPEAMTFSIPDDPESPQLIEIIKSKKIKTLIIGPGLGRTDYSEKIFINVIKSLTSTEISRVLIDGDGLYHLADYIIKEKLPDNIDFIITPHFMEASRLLKKDIDQIKNNRLKSCKELALHTGCVAVLKGPATVVSDGDISFINTTGNNGLATAGSGDVLSGIIGSMINRDITAIEAASAGVYIHGLCADVYSENSVISSMRASDIINSIRTVLKLKTDLFR